MKKLIYLRHAKSSWSDFSLTDHDRPLNKRGKRDAPVMANKLKQLNYLPELTYCSSAKRTQETLAYFKNELDLRNITLENKLYHASEEVLEQIVYEFDDKINTAMVIAHNPGLSFLINSYSDRPIDNVPTSGVFILKSSSKLWNDFFKNAELDLFIYPKMYQ